MFIFSYGSFEKIFLSVLLEICLTVGVEYVMPAKVVSWGRKNLKKCGILRKGFYGGFRRSTLVRL